MQGTGFCWSVQTLPLTWARFLKPSIGNKITPIGNVSGLDAIEINPEEAAAGYRERIVGPMRGILPADALRSIEEQLSGACTIEIAAFDEFTALLTDNDLLARYDHVVFDTAPTGHTIRMLKLPGAWSGFLKPARVTRPALARLQGWRNNAHVMPRQLIGYPTPHQHALSWWRARVSLP